MLKLNPILFAKRQQEEALKFKLEELKEQLEEMQETRKELEVDYKSDLEQKEQELIIQTRAIYANKFTAKLSEDLEFVEIYSDSSKLVAQYTKLQNGQFRPIGQVQSCENKAEDLLLSRTKPQFYTILERIFK